MFFTTKVMDNGLTVVHRHFDSNIAYIGLVVGVGAMHEEPPNQRNEIGQQGMAHFVEHLVSEHLENPTAQEAQKMLEAAGGYLDLGVTSYSATTFDARVPVDESDFWFKFVINLFSKMMFAKELVNIEKERKIILDELSGRYQKRQGISVAKHRNEALYGDSWLGKTLGVAGTFESVSQFTKKDLQDFYETHYTPQNMTFVVAGGVDLSQVVNIVQGTMFASGWTTDLVEINRANEPLKPKKPKPNRLEITDDSEDTATFVTVATVNFEENAYAAHCLCGVLTRRFEERFRKKEQLGYYSPEAIFSRYGSVLEFQIIENFMQRDVAKRIEALIEECFYPVGEKEFISVQQTLVNGLKYGDRNLEAHFEYALAVVEQGENIVGYEVEAEKYSATTVKHVQQVLDYIKDKENRWTFVVHPGSEE